MAIISIAERLPIIDHINYANKLKGAEAVRFEWAPFVCVCVCVCGTSFSFPLISFRYLSHLLGLSFCILSIPFSYDQQLIVRLS